MVGLLASDSLPAGKSVFYGIIADGIHTHAAALRIAFRTHPQGQKAIFIELNCRVGRSFNCDLQITFCKKLSESNADF